MAQAPTNPAADLGSNLDIPKVQKAARKPRAKAVPKEEAAKVDAPIGMKTGFTRIILEENDDIPPGGLYVGHNGRGYLIPTGAPVDVPTFLLDILDHAVMSAPQVDPQTKQVIGFRDRMKYPYRKV